MNYRVALCDDNAEDRQRISEFFLRFSMNRDADFYIDQYASGEELIEIYRQGEKKYDFLFLDMEMNGLSGIETAEVIRKIPDRDVLIIFITNYPEYMQDSFDVQASQYLMKPLRYERFEITLRKMISYLEELETNIRVISMNKEELILHLEDIVSIETVKSATIKSQLLVTTKTGEYLIKGKISVLEKELKGKYFIKVHRSVLVNMKYVKRIGDILEFTTGKEVGVSRQLIPEVKEAFTRYMVMRYRR